MTGGISAGVGGQSAWPGAAWPSDVLAVTNPAEWIANSPPSGICSTAWRSSLGTSPRKKKGPGVAVARSAGKWLAAVSPRRLRSRHECPRRAATRGCGVTSGYLAGWAAEWDSSGRARFARRSCRRSRPRAAFDLHARKREPATRPHPRGQPRLGRTCLDHTTCSAALRGGSDRRLVRGDPAGETANRGRGWRAHCPAKPRNRYITPWDDGWSSRDLRKIAASTSSRRAGCLPVGSKR